MSRRSHLCWDRGSSTFQVAQASACGCWSLQSRTPQVAACATQARSRTHAAGSSIVYFVRCLSRCCASASSIRRSSKCAVRQAGGFPEFRVHADGGEAGDGVDFVQQNAPGAVLEEKVHAGHAQAFERAERAHGVFLKFFHLRLGELRGNQQARAFLEIFRGVIVKFAVRDDLAGNRTLSDLRCPERKVRFRGRGWRARP